MSQTPRTLQKLCIETLERRDLLSVAPQMLGDLRQGVAPYDHAHAWLGNEVFFAADDGQGDVEIWKSDGTSEGTVRVKDIRLGASGSSPRDFIFADGRILFTAFSDDSGRELWTTDGTERGTKLVRDLAPGPESPTLDSFTPVGEKVFFRRNQQLWSTDGTPFGTVALTTNAVESFTPFDERLLFRADIGSGQSQLWMSDGTTDGTTVFSSEIDPSRVVVAGNLFYIDSQGDLWRSDGTNDGTWRLRSFERGPSQLTAVEDRLFFYVQDPPDWGQNGSRWELWHSDGTEEGTAQIKLLADQPRRLMAVGGELSFYAGRDSWRSDGTPDGTRRVTGGLPNNLQQVGDNLYVRPSGNADGSGVLWYSDGTEEGSMPVPGMENVNVDFRFRELNGMLYAIGEGVHGDGELWRTDGSEARTEFLGLDLWAMAANDSSTLIWSTVDNESGGLWALDEDLKTVSKIQAEILGPSEGSMIAGYREAVVHEVGAQVVYAQAGQLWRIDGTYSTPIEAAPAVISEPNSMMVIDDRLYFWGAGESAELWRTDGTNAGTVLVTDTVEDISSLEGATRVDGSLFFRGGGNRIWRLDEGQSEAVELPDLIRPPVQLNGEVILFRAGTDGTEIWKANGSAEQEQLLGVIPDGYFDPVIADNQLFIITSAQLWRTDGTADGTYWLLDGIDAHVYTDANERLFFLKSTGDNTEQLWVSDGTVAGTHLLKENVPWRRDCGVASLVALDGTVFFHAIDVARRPGLWKSDGTLEGTLLVKEMVTYPIIAGDGVVYFDGVDPSSGRELWKTDGTEEGTVKIADLNAGPAGSRRGKAMAAPNAAPVIEINGHLYFTADDGFHGYELWRLSTQPASPIPGDADGNGIVEFRDFIVLTANYGKVEDVVFADGDFDHDGVVDFADFLILASNYGRQ